MPKSSFSYLVLALKIRNVAQVHVPAFLSACASSFLSRFSLIIVNCDVCQENFNNKPPCHPLKQTCKLMS